MRLSLLLTVKNVIRWKVWRRGLKRDMWFAITLARLFKNVLIQTIATVPSSSADVFARVTLHWVSWEPTTWTKWNQSSYDLMYAYTSQAWNKILWQIPVLSIQSLSHARTKHTKLSFIYHLVSLIHMHHWMMWVSHGSLENSMWYNYKHIYTAKLYSSFAKIF